jgi:hypothetical protein
VEVVIVEVSKKLMEEGKDAKEIHERKREKRNGCFGKGE